MTRDACYFLTATTLKADNTLINMEYSNKSTHDEVNLARLLRRLEKSTSDPSWSNDNDESGTWLKAVDMLQVRLLIRLDKALNQTRVESQIRPVTLEEHGIVRL